MTHFSAASLILAGIAASVPAAVAGTTTPENIMLELVGGVGTTVCPNGFGFIRNSPGGSSLGIFKIPAGDILVVTDVDWQYVAPTGASAAGQSQTLRLFATPNKGAGGDNGAIILESHATLGSLGQGGANTITATGAQVGSRATLCVDVSPGPFASGGGVQSVIVRGMLVSTP